MMFYDYTKSTSSIPWTNTSRRRRQPRNDLPPNMTRKALEQRPIPSLHPVKHQLPARLSCLSSAFLARPLLAPHPANHLRRGVREHRVGVRVAFSPPSRARPRTARCGHRHVQNLRGLARGAGPDGEAGNCCENGAREGLRFGWGREKGKGLIEGVARGREVVHAVVREAGECLGRVVRSRTVGTGWGTTCIWETNVCEGPCEDPPPCLALHQLCDRVVLDLPCV